MEYFSEREEVPRPQDTEELSLPFWEGLVAVVRTSLDNGSLAESFPVPCPDGRGPYGASSNDFMSVLRAEIPEAVDFRLDAPPEDSLERGRGFALDLVEFLWRKVSTPQRRRFHEFPGHDDLGDFDRSGAQRDFEEQINLMLRRNGIAFVLSSDGQVSRLGTPVVSEAVRRASFDTGNAELDSDLERARTQYFSKSPDSQMLALQALWAAFERMKTLETLDKRQGADAESPREW